MASSTSERVKRNFKKHCSVFRCASKTSSDNDKLSYHILPKRNKCSVKITNAFGVREQVDVRTEWMRRLRIQNPFPNLRVCSGHFVPDDYFFLELDTDKRQLKKHALPSKNLPESSVKRQTSQAAKEQKLKRAERACKRQKISDYGAEQKKREGERSTSLIDESETSTAIVSDTELQLQLSPSISNEAAHQSQMALEDNDADKPLCLRQCFCKAEYEKRPSMVSKAIQVTSGEIMVPFSSILGSDRKLNSFCGIRSHKLLDEISCALKNLYPEERTHKLTLRDRIIMTMIKLKMDLSFRAISILFDSVSDETCSVIFYDTLRKLSTILKPMISWVSKEETLRNTPKCFAGFENTVVVVDCVEFSVQRPKCLACQNKVYSHYKSDYTPKFMTGVSPGGLLVFVSEAYGGRASDKAIFEQSNIINLMSRGDAVMVDKGFMVDDICNKNGVQIYRPSFLKKKSQLSEEEAVYSRKIACARVHVERMNQRIREFDVLQNRIDSYLLQNIDDIMIVCCAFANLGPPILADDKFM